MDLSHFHVSDSCVSIEPDAPLATASRAAATGRVSICAGLYVGRTRNTLVRCWLLCFSAINVDTIVFFYYEYHKSSRHGSVNHRRHCS